MALSLCQHAEELHDWPGLWNAWGDYNLQFQLRNVKGRENLKDISVDGRIISECILKQCGVGSFDWTELICVLL